MPTRYVQPNPKSDPIILTTTIPVPPDAGSDATTEISISLTHKHRYLVSIPVSVRSSGVLVTRIQDLYLRPTTAEHLIGILAGVIQALDPTAYERLRGLTTAFVRHLPKVTLTQEGYDYAKSLGLVPADAPSFPDPAPDAPPVNPVTPVNPVLEPELPGMPPPTPSDIPTTSSTEPQE